MKIETNKKHIQDFTRLPVHEIICQDKFLPDLLISTPHKGMVAIKLTEEHRGFFSGSQQIDRHIDEIVSQIQKLESEASDYLFNKWLKENG